MTEFIKWCNENQGFLSAGLSLVAIFAAIGIPAYVAHRQNKIALFDKRFSVITTLLQIIEFSKNIVKFGSDVATTSFWNGISNLKLWVVEKERFGVAIPALAIKNDVTEGSFRCTYANVDYDIQVLNAMLTDDLLQLKKAEVLLSKKTALLVNEPKTSVQNLRNSTF